MDNTYEAAARQVAELLRRCMANAAAALEQQARELRAQVRKVPPATSRGNRR